jgi:hypothetical protein
MVRAKVKLVSKVQHHWGSTTLRFDCQYDDTIPEDKRFQKATPSGHAEFMIDNPTAVAFFELGKNYYVDFIEVS